VIGDDSEIPDTVGVTSREWIVKGEFGPTAQDAYDNTVAASWIGNGDSFGSDRWSSYEDYGSGAGSNRWYCRMEAQSREYAVEHGFPFAAALDVWCLLNSSLYSSTYGTNVVFDSIDDGLSTNTYTKVYSETIAASAAWSGGFLLSTNFDTAMPYWGESGEIVVGWSLETYGINGVGWWAWLKKYNATTNGFKWFR